MRDESFSNFMNRQKSQGVIVHEGWHILLLYRTER